MATEPFDHVDAELSDIVRRVIEHVDRHPNAADTCQGIASWWLQEDHTARLPIVRKALDQLLVTGLFEARRLPSGDLLYSVKRDEKEAPRNENRNP